MLRVDQAGEYGATRIYAGQLAVLRRNCPEAKLIARMAAQEERHLKRFNALMAERRVRPTALQPLWNAYRTLAEARDRRAPLDLDLPERRVLLGSDGRVASIAFRERLESMRLIEEFMIMANVAAAETLEKARIALIYRVHEEPSHEKLVAFGDYLKSINISFAKGQVVMVLAPR